MPVRHHRGRFALQPARIRLRLIQPGTGTGAQTILGRSYIAQPWDGLNGRSAQGKGFHSGQYERRAKDEGTFQINLPNSAGPDGIMHRDRFLITSSVNYHPGDEWIEVWRQGSPSTPGDLLFVGTPVNVTVNATSIQINGFDALWVLKKTRETQAGFWANAPRDVFEAYTQVWQTVISDGFDAASVDSTKWTVTNNIAVSPLPSNLRLANTSAADPTLTSVATIPIGTGVSPGQRWRVEASYSVANFVNNQVSLQLYSAGNKSVGLTVNGPTSTTPGAQASTSDIVGTTRRATYAAGAHTMSIEGRDRWVFYYVDGQLVDLLPMPTGGPFAATVRFLGTFATTGTAYAVDLDYLLLRQAQIFIGGTGDYHLPGTPVPGGLFAQYCNDTDIGTDANLFAKVLSPIRVAPGGAAASNTRVWKPRLDPTVAFTASSSPTWQPAGGPPNGQYFSVRWTGSVYLDLATYNYRLQVLYAGGGVRLWVGKTRFGEQVVDDWITGAARTGTTGYLQTALGTKSGWYPVVLEYARLQFDSASAATGITLSYERSDAPGTFTAIPATALSPQGIFEQQVRNDSHYDLIRQFAESWGYQYTVAPRSLESGSFPGALIPHVREGRDTDIILDLENTTTPQLTINADDVADTLVADAQGLADPGGSSQLFAELFNFPQMATHLFPAQEYDSPGDIQNRQQLLVRLSSLLALRTSPFTNVTAGPHGHRELTDSFPLTGALSEMAWQPGDAVRIKIPEVGVDDMTPRQMLGITWQFAPDGLHPPAVSFRQRPRSFKETLRKILKESIEESRNYQGQFVVSTGTMGNNNGSNGVSTSSSDQYTRVPLPADLSRVVSATFVVGSGSAGAYQYQIFINGTETGIRLTTAGRYDVTAFVARPAAGDHRMYGQLTLPTTPSGTGVDYFLELLVRV